MTAMYETEVVIMPKEDRPLPKDSPLFPREIPLAVYLETLAPRNEPLTRYSNPLKSAQTVSIAVARRVCVRAASGERLHDVQDRVVIMVKPGETVAIPSKWDRVLHSPISKEGVIQGGAAPRLVNLDRPELRLSDLLMPAESATFDAPKRAPVANDDEPVLNKRGSH